jgi:radical SAM protein with 4Fe4S-binding SPASM domain
MPETHFHAPFHVTWFITKRCNLKCSHCFNYEPGELPGRAPDELDLDDCKKVVDDLADAGVFGITFGGGEVLSLPWFADLIEHCNDAGIGTCASSNGALLTPSLARRLRAAGMTSLQLSLDGATAELHDSIRGPGNFSAVLRATRICHDVAIAPSYAFTLMRENSNQLEQLLQLCVDQEVRRLKLQLYIPVGRATGAPLERAEQLRAFELCRRFEQTHDGFRVVYPCYMGHMNEDAATRWQPNAAATELSCGAGTTRAVIFETGQVGGCEFMRDDTTGNLRDQRFMDIWNSGAGAIEQWRRLDLVTGKCGSCGYQKDCGFGCRAMAFFVGGNFYGGDPSCVSSPPEGIVHPHSQKSASERDAEFAASPKLREQRRHLAVVS